MSRPDAVHEHLAAYTAAHWDPSTIAAATQLPQDQILALAKGVAVEVTEAERRIILGVDLDALLATNPNRVPAHLARWRLGSLMAVGHDLHGLAYRVGYNYSLLDTVMYGKGDWRRPVRTVSGILHDDVVTLWDLLADRPGASLNAKTAANRRKWRRPDEYAPDGTLWADIPPEERAKRRAAERRFAGLVRIEALRLSLREHLTPTVIAVRLSRTLGRPVRTSMVSVTLQQTGLVFDEQPVQGAAARCVLRAEKSRGLTAVLAAVQEWEHDPGQDPVPLVRKLGMLTTLRYEQAGRSGVGAVA